MRTLMIVFLLLMLNSLVAQTKKKLAFIPYADEKTGTLTQRKAAYDAIFQMAERIFINTQRFEILDRNNFSILQFEKDIQKGEAFVNSKIVQQGKMKAAEVIAVARITSMPPPTISSDKKGYSAYITVEFKEIDVETGQATSAYQLRGEFQDFVILNDLPRPSTPERAIDLAIRNMEKDLIKWISDNFPITMEVLDISTDSKNPKIIYANGGKNIGLTATHRMRIVHIERIGGKKVVKTIAKLKLHDRLEEETTQFVLYPFNKDQWTDVAYYLLKDKANLIITEDSK